MRAPDSFLIPRPSSLVRMLGVAMCLVTTAVPFVALAQTASPVASDSRVKTLVYNENDVYNLLTYYGFQSNIEFGPKETIETVSIGDRAGWQLVPAGRRLFVRAVANELHTNMTVVTNLRAYQFDLRATDPATVPQEELVYVIRFFYPEDAEKAQKQIHMNPVPVAAVPAAYPTPAPAPLAPLPVESTALPPMNPAPAAMPQPAPRMEATAGSSNAAFNTGTVYGAGPFDTPLPATNTLKAPPANAPSPSNNAVVLPKGVNAQKANFNYTYTGSNQILPYALLDDGKRTYFQFRNMPSAPKVQAWDKNGKSQSVRLKKEGEYYVASVVASRFEVTHNGQTATIYNEMRPQN